jgi:hypothetical protein
VNFSEALRQNSDVQRRLQGRGLYLLPPLRKADSKMIIFTKY